MDNNSQDYGYQENGQDYAYGQPDGYARQEQGCAGGYTQYQYAQQGGYEQELEPPMTMGEWLVSLLLLMIPCVGIVLLFVWAFSGNEKKSKSNFCKAYLIMLGVVLALYLLAVIFIAAMALA